MSKNAVSSKINLVGAALVIVPLVEPARDFVVNVVPDPYKPVVVSAFGLLLIVLRTFFTNQAVHIKPQ